MRALLPSVVEAVAVRFSAGRLKDRTLGRTSLETIGDRLRATYEVADEPLPAKLAELVEQMARRECIVEGTVGPTALLRAQTP